MSWEISISWERYNLCPTEQEEICTETLVLAHYGVNQAHWDWERAARLTKLKVNAFYEA